MFSRGCIQQGCTRKYVFCKALPSLLQSSEPFVNTDERVVFFWPRSTWLSAGGSVTSRFFKTSFVMFVCVITPLLETPAAVTETERDLSVAWPVFLWHCAPFCSVMTRSNLTISLMKCYGS
ncbi:unnamed protein product [Discosporangium mesarthrocarpum]